MRIAQVSPLFESVPPKLYGGTERVVAYLTEELVARGHEVTLFATADSETSARLVAPCEQSLRLVGREAHYVAYHLIMLEQLFAQIGDFDVVHFHIDHLQFPFLRRGWVPNLTTMHGRLDLPELGLLFRTYPGMPMASISNAQRTPLPWLNWQATLYHGLPPELYEAYHEPEDYLVFLGRIAPEKGPAAAIDIAKKARRRLVIAAKVDRADRDYFEAEIEPLLDHPLIEFIGEVEEDEKNYLVGNALGVLFPIDWPEPFGMVMIESFACGTPVIAFPRGSVPEIMRDGVSGFVVDGIDEAVAAVERLRDLDRRRCRAYFDERFTVARMADDHLAVYDQLLREPAPPLGRDAREPGRLPRLPDLGTSATV